MHKVNALQVRQAFGKILKRLQKSGEPIVIDKGRSPVAVLISMKVFKERFVDYRERQKREELLQRFHREVSKPAQPSLNVLRYLRYGPDH